MIFLLLKLFSRYFSSTSLRTLVKFHNQLDHYGESSSNNMPIAGAFSNKVIFMILFDWWGVRFREYQIGPLWMSSRSVCFRCLKETIVFQREVDRWSITLPAFLHEIQAIFIQCNPLSFSNIRAEFISFGVDLDKHLVRKSFVNCVNELVEM